MNMIDAPIIRGDLQIIETNVETGESEIVLDEKNMIMNSGARGMLRAINPKLTSNEKIAGIRLGSDFGAGTTLAPQTPVPTLVSSNQTVTFTIPQTDITITQSGQTMTLKTVINGTTAVGDLFYIPYTSASIFLDNGDLFSYKRFPLRILSRAVNVTITWKLSVGDAGDCTI